MKTLLSAFLLVAFISFNANSQVSEGMRKSGGATFILNDSTEIFLGDTILIDLPATNDFLFVSQQKKKFGLSKLSKLGDLGSAVGGTLGTIGAATGSLGTLRTGVEIMNAGAVARSVGMTSEAIENLAVSKKAKKIIGTQAVVESFHPADGDEDYIKALVVNEKENKRFEVILAPAIYTGEIYLSK